MIGIIGAMTVEVEQIKALMTDKRTDKISGIEFVCGKLFGKDAVAAVSGVGKVNAAVCTQTMILKYAPSLVINTGVAGGLDENLKIGDIALSCCTAEHDMDTTPLGEPKGFISGLETVKIKADEKALEDFKKVLTDLELNFVVGPVASGDQFINSPEEKERIKTEFSAVCCEMEGASIGHVCAMNNIPFIVLRAISDGADDNSHLSFPEFVKMAADNSIKVLAEYFKQ